MANTISLRIVYKSSTKKVVSLSKAKYAHIYYGRKKIVTLEFSKVTASISSKTRQLNKQISSIKKVNKFLNGLRSKSSKGQKASQKKKSATGAKGSKTSPIKTKKKPKVSSSKKAKKPVKKSSKPKVKEKKIYIKKGGKIISDLEGLIKRERLDRKNSWKEKPRFRSIYGDVRFIPFIPETDFYKKLLVQKKVRSSSSFRTDLLYLEIMDYKLKVPFEVTETNTKEAIEFIKFHFFPHIDYFIRRFAGKNFIFRISFIRFDDEGNPVNHGYSGSRFTARHMDDFKLLGADFLLKPEKFLYSHKSRNTYIRLSLSNTILLTGFTLEVVDRVHKNYFKKDI